MTTPPPSSADAVPAPAPAPASGSVAASSPAPGSVVAPKRPHFGKLSIVIPVYNEEATIHELIRLVVEAVLPAHLEKEIICVNDASKDGTAKKLDELPMIFPGENFVIRHKTVNE